jgi:hypothetical protein
MNSQQVSVVLHVRDAFEQADRAALEQAVGQQTGVKQARGGAKTPQLLLIDYDPFATSAGRILEAVRSRGLDARLIGL